MARNDWEFHLGGPAHLSVTVAACVCGDGATVAKASAADNWRGNSPAFHVHCNDPRCTRGGHHTGESALEAIEKWNASQNRARLAEQTTLGGQPLPCVNF